MTTDLDPGRTRTSGGERTGMSTDERALVADLATQFRVRSVQMAERAGSGHPTSSMSAADLLAVLTARHLRLDPSRPDAPGNDRIVFSKGHASPLLYSVLEVTGVLDGQLDGFDDAVAAYRQRTSILEGHPTPLIPAVPAATGSLGLGLAIGVGLATANRLAHAPDAHVWVLCGDGELAEGAIWEAVEHAGSARVQGITAIVDVNRLGQTGPTRHGWDVDAYRERFDGFGWWTVLVDGHDLGEIDAALADARDRAMPTAIIARTEKGRGASETADVEGKHGKPLDDPEQAIDELGEPRHLRCTPRPPDRAPTPTGPAGAAPDLPQWDVGTEVATRDAFGEAMVAIGRWREDVVALDGDVGNSTRLAGFAERFPGRFVQAYIAEQLMSGAAIGLHAAGWRPVMATFGAFLTRAHDVLRMATVSRADIAVVGSHAGVSIGEDGPSQMALEDLAMMRCLAGSTVLSPSDANQTAALLAAMFDRPGISYLRVMRGSTPVVHDPGATFEVGGSVLLRPAAAPDVTIMATGVTVHEALEAADRLDGRGLSAQVLDVYSLKPIDREAVVAAARASGRLVVVEDHRPEGGLGDAVFATLAGSGVDTQVAHLAVDEIPGSATPSEQRAAAGIDAEAITRAALDDE